MVIIELTIMSRIHIIFIVSSVRFDYIITNSLPNKYNFRIKILTMAVTYQYKHDHLQRSHFYSYKEMSPRYSGSQR